METKDINIMASPEPSDAVYRNILSRTSKRKFDISRGVPDDYINMLLHAGMAAPSGVNRQPWHFVVITSREVLDMLAEKLPYCHMAKEAPLAIAVCGDSRNFLGGDDSTLWVQDVSAVSENILLMANALGLGAVWTAVYPHPDRAAIVSKVLGLDKTIVPFNIIPIGYSPDTHKPLDKWNPEKVTYIR